MGNPEAPAALRRALANALDITLDGVIMFDAEQRILLFNQGAARIFGYNTAEIVGQKLDSLLPLRFAEPHIRHVRTFAASPKAAARMGTSQQVRGRRKDGSEFPIDASISKHTHGGETVFTIILRDVTESQQAQESLGRWRRLFEDAGWGLAIVDVDSATLGEMNPAFAQMHGYSVEELVGRSITDIVAPDFRAAALNRIRTLSDTGHEGFEAKGLRKDGTVFPALMDVTGLGNEGSGRRHCVINVQDITERVLSFQVLEQRVAERTEELSALLEVSRNVASNLELKPLLTVILTQLEHVLDFTGAMILIHEEAGAGIVDYRGHGSREEMLGYRFPSVADPLYQNLLASDETLMLGDIWEDPLRRGTLLAQPNHELGGFFVNIHSWMAVPLISQGQSIGVIGIGHDEPHHFTQQHARLALAFADHAATAIRNADLYKQAQQFAALEERQRLARELHDSVAQALYGIGLGASAAQRLLGHNPAEAAASLDYVQTLVEVGLAEMRALIFNLRPELMELEGLTIGLAKYIAALRARHGLEVHTVLGDEPAVPVETKETLYRIAREAMLNAVKHAHPTRLDLRLEYHDRRLILEVTDNGAGFDASESFPGHLGLRSMRERTERLGGTLTVDSHRGSGTCIRVEVPTDLDK